MIYDFERRRGCIFFPRLVDKHIDYLIHGWCFYLQSTPVKQHLPLGTVRATLSDSGAGPTTRGVDGESQLSGLKNNSTIGVQ